MRILYAEDEISLAVAIKKILEKNNYSVDIVHNGEDALDYLRAGNYDLAVLDIMMPKLDGLSVIERIRREGNLVPILILSAKGEIEDKVAGLDKGANDYLAKPFDTRELLARIRALTRGAAQGNSVLSFGNVVLDRATYILSSVFGEFRLTNKEFQIMELLLSNPGSIISSERIMERIWGYDSEAEINVVWVYISYLRKKLYQIGADIEIKVSRNVGYLIEKKKND